jgi:glycine/D-amino acid oxidase-like deaminating enzyme
VQKFKVNEYIFGAISYTAGALWPYRFVSSVWKDLLTKHGEHLSIETGTAVTDIVPWAAKDTAYKVVTARGDITCQHIVHANNAFAGQFIPGLRGKLTGVVAHMSAQRPGQQFPDTNGARSWLVIYGQDAYDYVTQRPTFDGVQGDLMLGGGFHQGKDRDGDRLGHWDDSTSSFDALTFNHIGNIFPTIFTPHWGDDQQGGRIKSRWTGILGVTGDWLPLVGRLDPKLTNRRPTTAPAHGEVSPGEWVAAGFCGEGMVWAWLSGAALGIMLAGSENEVLPEIPGRPGGRLDDWYPRELEPSAARVRRADMTNLIERAL